MVHLVLPSDVAGRRVRLAANGGGNRAQRRGGLLPRGERTAQSVHGGQPLPLRVSDAAAGAFVRGAPRQSGAARYPE